MSFAAIASTGAPFALRQLALGHTVSKQQCASCSSPHSCSVAQSTSDVDAHKHRCPTTLTLDDAGLDCHSSPQGLPLSLSAQIRRLTVITALLSPVTSELSCASSGSRTHDENFRQTLSHSSFVWNPLEYADTAGLEEPTIVEQRQCECIESGRDFVLRTNARMDEFEAFRRKIAHLENHVLKCSQRGRD